MQAVVNREARLTENGEEKTECQLVKREREKVDASKLHVLASTILRPNAQKISRLSVSNKHKFKNCIIIKTRKYDQM